MEIYLMLLSLLLNLSDSQIAYPEEHPMQSSQTTEVTVDRNILDLLQ